jgi:hypothetical protein
MTSPFPFSSGAVLTSAQLNAIGDYESWTPTLTNITLGSGTVNAHYVQVNEFVHFEIEFLSASDTSFSSTSMQFSMPVNYGGALNFVGLGNCWVRPQASTIYPVQVIGVQSTNRIVPYYMQNYTSVQVISVRETLPETWTKSSGVLYMAGSYRAA